MARDPSGNIQRGTTITLTIDQQEVTAYSGETLATVLLAQGISQFNHSLKGQARGPYCNMGTCYECQVQLALEDTVSFLWVRACMLPAQQGMSIRTGARILTDPAEARPDNAGDTDHAN